MPSHFIRNRSLFRNLRHSVLWSVLVPLLVSGCSTPQQVEVRRGTPAPKEMDRYQILYEGSVTQRASRAQYTVLEQFSPTAPIPKHGYALNLKVDVKRTWRGDLRNTLDLFIVDPETKHSSAPVQGKPNVVFGAHVFVGLDEGKPAVIWVVDGHDLLP